LDKFYWKPNWQKVESTEWHKIQNDLISRDRWIIDGNYTSTIDIRLEAADTVIFLKFNKFICLGRAVKRRFFPSTDRSEELGGGNKERLTWNFLRWIWIYPAKETVLNLKRYRDKKIIIFNNPKELEKFLDQLVGS
jgi:adenylate kinase family enzyme